MTTLLRSPNVGVGGRLLPYLRRYGKPIPRILAQNTRPVSELTEDGAYVTQLATSDGEALVNPQIVGGNGAFAIGDVPETFRAINGLIEVTENGDWIVIGSGTIKGVVVADESLLTITGASTPITVSSDNHANITFNVPHEYAMLAVASNIGLRVAPGIALRVY